ncbi:putative PEP-CTERM exosortase interaction domain-containing protein [Rubrivivax sp. A210]|uniref:PQQ-dependent sugar dehydrogenase n=1 Tax=Rubrivivax sp. A210 TaxID=2772301 RepID=UPI00191B6283|nr:PQQ-dependent sugar dehydrogenase [Rubrivivax sp. A210]CAD5373242.1 putative PEP-CTERM exosortase interaction domain-containing protein [Rubrivivax sp. A210]
MTTPFKRLVRQAACVLALAAASAAQAQPRDLLPSIPRGDIALNLLPVATGLAAPLYGTVAPGDASRLYVLEQGGQVRVLLNGVMQAGSVLDISTRMVGAFVPTSANDERGLLGLAFHPDFANPAAAGFRTLYTYNSEPIGTSAPTYAVPNGASQGYKNVVNEWKMGAAGVVDPATRREVISFGKNANNHNGGTIAFGHDGYMYLALGDGGNANDASNPPPGGHIEPGGNAQSPNTPLGKMLRFDPIAPALSAGSLNAPSANGQYRVPADNMGVAAGLVPEQYALGFRNPYRFSVDTANGRIIIADVGQGNIEEIDLLVPGGNYGWAIKEGDFAFNRVPGGAAGTGARSPGSPAGLIDPISGPLGTLEYDHQDGISITGGFVYRGQDIPALFGKYVFGDLALRAAPTRVDGRLFYADLETGLIREFLLPSFANGILPNGLTVHGFGQDAAGELYAMVTNTPASGLGGIVYRLTLAPVPEPATWAMWAAGGLMLMARRLRRRG